ncbi:DNA-binding transcriptional regulator, MerR family [Duganella sacchari]|uniref:DNA-binding transcriptional regulator, MerR family n=1 Tax=Duganella sacchari TaxID=551987 RepID=A0A1M7R9Q1_9BURK|nr:MerR family transcriptional regulator [Duganella sacchari]SHN42880.1 DNA-binding transcriptional regulator, MerR family [Duganella sacchari]
MKIGELSRKAGIATSAIRYYEEQGLLAPTSRTPSGYREYADNAPERLQLIQTAKKLGFSLEVIRDLLDLNGKCSIEKTMRQTSILLQEVEQQQAALARQRASLLALRTVLMNHGAGHPVEGVCAEHFTVN